MLIEVTIEDLVSMICGTDPDHEIIKELENKCLGYYHGGFNDYWSWNKYALLQKSEIGGVMPKGKAVLCPGSEHPVRLFSAQSDKIVDKDADICLGTGKNQRRLALQVHSCVDACHKPLAPCLLVA